MTYANHFAARTVGRSTTPQNQPLLGREGEMKRNRAGGHVFVIDAWDRFDRFLILGSDTPTFYADARETTLDNVEGVLAVLGLDGLRAVRRIVEISKGGRAPKNDPALYALALAASYGARAPKNEDSVSAARRNTRSTQVSATESLADRLVRNEDPSANMIRRAAFAALSDVARTASHLMQFVGFLETLRGWGQRPMKAVRLWLEGFDDDTLALQAVKYRTRNGWSMRDILRLAHPELPVTDNRRVLLEWIAHRHLTREEIQVHAARVRNSITNKGARTTGRTTARRHVVRPGMDVAVDAGSRFQVIDGFHRVQEAASAAEAARIVRCFGLPHECVPSEFLKSREVWDALLVDMPQNALVRNLNRMTSVGLLSSGSEAARHVAERLTDVDALRGARVHPFGILVALEVYRRGKGILGNLEWTPAGEVVDGLDAAFYASFAAVRPSGKRFMQCLDVSGSMTMNFLVGGWRKDKLGRATPVPGPVSAHVAAAAMAMVGMASERSCFVGGFTSGRGRKGEGFTPLPDVSPRRRLDDVVASISRLPFGNTDASLPIAYATANGIEVDAFVIYTDNETWDGKQHVTEALREYREKTGIQARLIAAGMTATDYSVVDPADPLQMNVVGFDANAPAVISDFVRG